MRVPLQFASASACHRRSVAKQKEHTERRIWLPETADLPSDAIEADATWAKPEKSTLLLYKGGALTQLNAGHRRRRAGRGLAAQELEAGKGSRREQRERTRGGVTECVGR